MHRYNAVIIVKDREQVLEAKGKILKAATEIFLTEGLPGLSVRAIANHAGVSTIGIYSHFKGKQGILDALYIEGFERLRNAMNVLGEGGSPREDILLACRNYLRIGDEYQAHYRLMFGEESRSFKLSNAAQEAAWKAFALVLDLSKAYLPDGASKENIEEFSLGVWSVVHGYTGLRHHLVSRIVHFDNWEDTIIQAIDSYIGGYKYEEA